MQKVHLEDILQPYRVIVESIIQYSREWQTKTEGQNWEADCFGIRVLSYMQKMIYELLFYLFLLELVLIGFSV